MTFLLETTAIGIITAVLIVFQVLVCILLILVVMMQRPKQEGLGAAFGGDTMDSLTGAHATDFLQKGTALLGTILFVLTFAVSMLVIAGQSNKTKTSTNGSEPAPKTVTDPKLEGDINNALTSPDEDEEEDSTNEEGDSEGESGDAEASSDTEESSEPSGENAEKKPEEDSEASSADPKQEEEPATAKEEAGQ